MLTGSVSTDINGERQDPNVRMLNTVHHLMHARHNSSTPFQQRIDPPPAYVPTIRYTIQGQATLLNQWQDSHYFLAAFPTLFPMGVGRHIDTHAIPVSLSAFADWALRHHTRRHGPSDVHTECKLT